MNIKHVLIAFLSLQTACASVPQSYRYESLNPQTDHIQFKFLAVSEKNGNTVLSGALFHQFSKVEFDKGHVDISVYDSTGQFLFDAIGTYRSPINSYREWVQVGVKFKSQFPKKVPQGAVIKLAFHVDQPLTPSQHDQNISR